MVSMVSGCGTDWEMGGDVDLGHHQNHGDGVVGFIVFFLFCFFSCSPFQV